MNYYAPNKYEPRIRYCENTKKKTVRRVGVRVDVNQELVIVKTQKIRGRGGGVRSGGYCENAKKNIGGDPAGGKEVLKLL